MNEIARLFFTAPPAVAIDGPADWLRRHRAAVAGIDDTVLCALAGGRVADRPGWAFASGYLEALRRLVPPLGGRATCLAATEAGGAHPRAIATRLAGGRLDGVKRFVTLAPACEAVVVIASEGESGGRNRLAAVVVPLDRDGVSLEALPPTPFAPEVPHAAVSFRAVAVGPDERLAGDGYTDYLKPFRTVEDIHVVAAITAWLAAVHSRAGPLVEELAALAASLVAIGRLDPRAHATHRVLGGALAALEAALARAEPLWAEVGAEARARWQRDRPLLQVAGSARAARLNRARSGSIE
ncbi:MAG TPA: acyl-CoA dehydrogenase family protein [Kofleriaceae bacterium]|nr:acyl-CoA dehydrogenase family protein [Kofleriaceae bacterium]